MMFILSVGTSCLLWKILSLQETAGNKSDVGDPSDSHWHLDPLKWVDVNKPELTSVSERSPRGEKLT